MKRSLIAAVAILLDLEIGIIAIVVGFMVGKAIRAGSTAILAANREDQAEAKAEDSQPVRTLWESQSLRFAAVAVAARRDVEQ